jgi:hypothetical protein
MDAVDRMIGDTFQDMAQIESGSSPLLAVPEQGIDSDTKPHPE